MRLLELKIPPPLLGLATIGMIVACAKALPAADVPIPGNRIAALLLGLAGLFVTLGSALQFRRARTTLNPRKPSDASRFVSHGIYRYTRNPMYLGMLCVLLGVALWRANLAGFVPVAAFFFYLTEFQIKPEERALQALFGADYRDYMARVRRWL